MKQILIESLEKASTVLSTEEILEIVQEQLHLRDKATTALVESLEKASTVLSTKEIIALVHKSLNATALLEAIATGDSDFVQTVFPGATRIHREELFKALKTSNPTMSMSQFKRLCKQYGIVFECKRINSQPRQYFIDWRNP